MKGSGNRLLHALDAHRLTVSKKGRNPRLRCAVGCPAGCPRFAAAAVRSGELGLRSAWKPGRPGRTGVGNCDLAEEAWVGVMACMVHAGGLRAANRRAVGVLHGGDLCR